MYIFSEAKKIDFIWKLWRRETKELSLYDYGVQKGREVLVEGVEMQSSTPEAQGISSEAMMKLYELLSQDKKIRPHSLAIAKNGKIITKGAWLPYSLNVRHVTHSVSKSVVSIAVGIACDEGLLRLDDKLCDILPDKFTILTPIKMRKITIEHLLTMETGARFNEGDTIINKDWLRLFIDNDAKFEAGERFEYNSLNTYVLCCILEKVTGMNLVDYLKPRLFEPLEMENILWETCPKGVVKGGWGLYLGTIELVKIGQLCLNGGYWYVDGKKTSIVSQQYIKRATQSHIEHNKGGFGYGYQMWVIEDGFMFNGMFGQYVLVYPKEKVVVALNSGADNIMPTKHVINIFHEYFVKGKGRKTMPLSRIALNNLRKLENNLVYQGEKKKISIGNKKVTNDKIKSLDKRKYDVTLGKALILPVMTQCLHNNYSNAIEGFGFEIIDGIFNLWVRDKKKRIYIPMGFDGKYERSILRFNGEQYIVECSAQFKQDEDDNDVLKIKMCFCETTSVNLIKIVFDEEYVLFKMTETPDFNKIFSNFIKDNEETLPKNIVNTIENRRDVVELLAKRMIAPVLRAKEIT